MTVEVAAIETVTVEVEAVETVTVEVVAVETVTAVAGRGQIGGEQGERR